VAAVAYYAGATLLGAFQCGSGSGDAKEKNNRRNKPECHHFFKKIDTPGFLLDVPYPTMGKITQLSCQVIILAIFPNYGSSLNPSFDSKKAVKTFLQTSQLKSRLPWIENENPSSFQKRSGVFAFFEIVLSQSDKGVWYGTIELSQYLKQQEGKTLEFKENWITRKISTSELLLSSLPF